MNDFNNVSIPSLPDHEPRQHLTAMAEPWPAEFPNHLLSDYSANLGFESWLTHENVQGFLHNWDFDLDGVDFEPVADFSTVSIPVANLQQSWYTHLADDQAVSGEATPGLRHTEVDDNYRQTLHRKLEVQSVDQSLPSADFLNLCVKAYFKRFHRLFPVIHAANFRPSKTNSVLLLSICSIGSLLTGHPSAAHRGTQLFERLHKAILAHWQKLMRRGPEETLAMIQAALLGQTFGLLSGQAKNLALVDAFHGTVISWARRTKLFHAQHANFADHQDLQSNWRDWVQTEERIRVALALRIHDAEIGNILHHETLLPCASKMSHAASDALFFASTAEEWFSLYRNDPAHPATPVSESHLVTGLPEMLHQRLMSIPAHCHFTIYAALQDISSAIIEARINESLSQLFVDKIQQCLMEYKRSNEESEVEAIRTSSKILWHYLFITLHCDLELLERCIGRDGPELDPADVARIHEWANSDAARRCAAHAIMIKRNMEAFPLTSEPGIHVPRAMFSSAICLFCYSKYSLAEGHSVTFPELQLVGADVTLLLKEAKSRSSEIGPLYALVDILQRVGHWEISRTFASILGALLQAESV